MPKNLQKEIFKWLLAILGFITIVFTVFLYLGDTGMKKELYEKIIATIVISLSILALGTLIVGLWVGAKIKDDSMNLYSIVHNDLTISTTRKIIVINSDSNNNHIDCYDSLGQAIDDITKKSIIYILNGNESIKAEDLQKLVAKQVVIKFINANFVVEMLNVSEHKSASQNTNKPD